MEIVLIKKKRDTSTRCHLLGIANLNLRIQVMQGVVNSRLNQLFSVVFTYPKISQIWHVRKPCNQKKEEVIFNINVTV